jgi:acetyl-CoA carboxylase beta subunit
MKLMPNIHYQIKHGDVINLGKLNSLLIHIHKDSKSCNECQDHFEIKANDENEISLDFSKLSLTNKEDERRENLKAMKKKY